MFLVTNSNNNRIYWLKKFLFVKLYDQMELVNSNSQCVILIVERLHYSKQYLHFKHIDLHKILLQK